MNYLRMREVVTFSFLLYALSLVVLINFSCFIGFWVSLEINMIVFILFNYYSSTWNGVSASFGMDYLLVQSLSSMIILGVSLSWTSFSVVSLDTALGISLCLKMGIFPLHFWVYKLSWSLGWLPFCALLALQKGPLMILLSLLSGNVLMWIFLPSMVFGAFMMMVSESLKEMLVSSSIYFSFWFLLFFSSSLAMGVTFCVLYFFSLLFMGWGINSLSMDSSTFLSKSAISSLPLFFLIGVPPLLPFLMKFTVIDCFSLYQSNFCITIFWLSLFASLMGYLKFLMSFLRPWSFLLFKEETVSAFLTLFLSGILLML